MNFNFSNMHYRGSNNFSKITNDQAHDICTLLSTTLLSCEQIARKTRSTKHIVYQIYRGATWIHISHYYKFKNRRPKHLMKKNLLSY